jgi:hypothetical protein
MHDIEGDGASRQESRLPPLPKRLFDVFFSPGRLNEQLAENPKWIGALLVSAAIVGLSMALIPAEVFLEFQREQALERGVDFPELSDRMVRVTRVIVPSLAAVSTLLFTFLFAGLYTLVFAFILGDEGRYVQYLAVVSHAWFIAALFGLLITPLRISTGDPQLTLNLANFLFFLPDGYLLNVFRVLDLTQIWSTLVIAQGTHAIYSRRSFASAATILLIMLLGVALIVARFIP